MYGRRTLTQNLPEESDVIVISNVWRSFPSLGVSIRDIHSILSLLVFIDDNNG